jgi:hypothetical protein
VTVVILQGVCDAGALVSFQCEPRMRQSGGTAMRGTSMGGTAMRHCDERHCDERHCDERHCDGWLYDAVRKHKTVLESTAFLALRTP